jgi:hypothetical protein
MTIGSLISGIVVAMAFALAGIAMLFFPDRLQQRALRANYSKRNWPVLGHLWYEAVRKPSYVVGMRISGIVAFGAAALLLMAMISSLLRVGIDL